MNPIFDIPKEEGNIGEVTISLKMREKDNSFSAIIQSYKNNNLLGTDLYEYVVPKGENSKTIQEIMGEIGQKFATRFEKEPELSVNKL